DHLERLPIQRQRLSQYVILAAEICLPESITQHGDGSTARPVIRSCNQPAGCRIHAKGSEVIPTHEQALYLSNVAAPLQSHSFRAAPPNHAREDILLITHTFPQRIRKTIACILPGLLTQK